MGRSVVPLDTIILYSDGYDELLKVLCSRVVFEIQCSKSSIFRSISSDVGSTNKKIDNQMNIDNAATASVNARAVGWMRMAEVLGSIKPRHVHVREIPCITDVKALLSFSEGRCQG